MNTPHHDCTHCHSSNTEYRGQQPGVEPATRKCFEYPLFQCLNPGCETSFGVIADKTYTGRMFEAKAVCNG